MKKIGFTLAEVLVTLSIIGVVAALTIPSLVKNATETQLRTKFKNVFSELNRAHLRIKEAYDGAVWTAFTDDGTGQNDMRDAFLDYLPYIKKCDAGSAVGTCFTATCKDMDGTSDTVILSSFSRAILSNGAALSFFRSSPTCASTVGTLPNQDCGVITIDVNNLSGPNVIGKDIYLVEVTKYAIYPHGARGINENSCATTGYGCAALIIQNQNY